jgi:predicted amidohydrolase
MEDGPHTVERNLALALEYISEAAANHADIVCLPETVTTNKVESGYHAAEHFPGEWTKVFQNAALQRSIAIVAPYYVIADGITYNQATVFARDGTIAGFYRKVQPTGWEARSASPGSELPLIKMEFGKIAVMICMDIYFPEIARIYAMKGAEILFWPTITHGPSQSGLEAQIRSRAMDNSLVIVESNLSAEPPYAPYKGRFYPGTARIVDHNGDIIAFTGRRPGLTYADIDLDEPRKTLDCFLIEDADKTRQDVESLVRMDLYAKEYATLAEKQTRFYDTIAKRK